MTIENDLHSALSNSRPAPGPGFEARMRAGALGHAVTGTRVRFRTALAVASVGAVAVAAVVAFVVTRDDAAPVEKQVVHEAAHDESPSPAEPARDVEVARKPAPAGVTVDRGVAERMMGELPTVAKVERVAKLSTSGRDSVIAALDRAKKAEIQLRARADIMFVDLERELVATKVNEAAIAKLVEDIARVDGQRRLARMRAWLVLRRVLPDQAFKNLLEDRVLSDSDKRKRRTKAREQIARAKGENSCDEVACLVDPTISCCSRGKLQINAVPWASVKVDGRVVGNTPLILKLPPGRHSVTLRSKGYKTERFRVKINAEKTTRVSRKLKKLREAPAPSRDFR